MTKYKKCICTQKDIENWIVVYQSDSAYVVRCCRCRCVWKTRAQYVSELSVYVPGNGLKRV
ncbi:MAG: hypothetical protein FWE69_06140 [Clostridiales bacterium]|nr:hypothetical protein [Clostridiales bacterium]